MNETDYLIPAKTGQHRLEVKRSKFLSFADFAANRSQAERFIANLRTLHPQANHVCWAYIAVPPNSTVRSMSDDGEPSGTAGMPMLKVLAHSGLGNIVVAVVRYFGGTKLGTGGLQRAYSDAVSELLSELPTQLQVQRSTLTLIYDYHFQGALSQCFTQYDIQELNSDFQQQVTTTLALANSQVNQFIDKIITITSGNIQLKLPDPEE